jgi:nucleoside phosphorylase/DNA-binding CsgD family transcriptional regulator
LKAFRVAILTAKEVEYNAVRKHLINEQRVDDTFDGTVYRRAKIRREPGSDVPIEQWDIAIYRTGRGQQPATYGTQILLQHFRPDVVLYVGIAGGDPTHADLSIGDVVIGKVVRYYERTSQYVDHFLIKDESHSPARALISAAEYEASEPTWLKWVEGERPNSRVFIHEIASGEKVQKSSTSAFWTAIKDRYPDVIAVETEGQGFYYAVAQSAGRGLMIRAISDLLGNKDDDESDLGSDDERQALASDRAAAFAINLIANLNTTFLEEINRSAPIRYAVILKISTDNIEGVHRATRLLADAINDPYLVVESLQPVNSFMLRVSTSLHSAAYARAIFRGGFISDLLGTEVPVLESDVERTGDAVFDDFLDALITGNTKRILSAETNLVESYPSWRTATFALERVILARNKSVRASENLSETTVDRPSPRDFGLTQRQQDVLALMMQGNSNKVIARTLNLDQSTVARHVGAILRALKASNRTEAVITVSELGWKFPGIVQR